MFSSHQPTIAEYGQRGPNEMARVLTFVIVTIRNPLHNVPDDMKTVYEGGDDEVPSVLFGHKASAWAHFDANKHYIYHDLTAMWEHGEAIDVMLAYLARRPGLGFVKAGFALQLLFGVAGCLDTHNQTRFGIAENTFDAHKAKAKRYATRLKHAQAYLAACTELGGCEFLWNSWCEFVAAKYPDTYTDAGHVSRLHVDAILPERRIDRALPSPSPGRPRPDLPRVDGPNCRHRLLF